MKLSKVQHSGNQMVMLRTPVKWGNLQVCLIAPVSAVVPIDAVEQFTKDNIELRKRASRMSVQDMYLQIFESLEN